MTKSTGSAWYSFLGSESTSRFSRPLLQRRGWKPWFERSGRAQNATRMLTFTPGPVQSGLRLCTHCGGAHCAPSPCASVQVEAVDVHALRGAVLEGLVLLGRVRHLGGRVKGQGARGGDGATEMAGTKSARQADVKPGSALAGSPAAHLAGHDDVVQRPLVRGVLAVYLLLDRRQEALEEGWARPRGACCWHTLTCRATCCALAVCCWLGSQTQELQWTGLSYLRVEEAREPVGARPPHRKPLGQLVVALQGGWQWSGVQELSFAGGPCRKSC